MQTESKVVLLIAQHVGFLEREVQAFVQRQGYACPILRLDKGEVEGADVTIDIPVRPKESTSRAAYSVAYAVGLRRLSRALAPHMTFALGLNAAAIWATKTNEPFVALMGAMDLTFSRANASNVAAFEVVNTRASGLCSADVLVANQLIDKGSWTPQYFWRPYCCPQSAADTGSDAQWTRLVFFAKSRQRNVALGTAERASVRQKLRAANLDVQIGSYFRASKAPASPPTGDKAPFEELTVDRILNDELPTTFCVLLGDSNGHPAAARYAACAGASVVLEDTAHNRLLALGLRNARVEPRWRIVQDLPTLMAESAPLGACSEESCSNSELVHLLDDSYLKNLPYYHEVLIPPAGDEDAGVVVIGAVGGFPSARNRARAVRIQSLLEVFHARYSVLLLQVSEQSLLRRGRLLQKLTAEGRVRFVYMESSTSPVAPALQEPFFDVMKDLKGAGVPLGWFARDAHYLDRDFGFEETHRQTLLQDGKEEARRVQETFDVVFAPSTRLFDRFVEGGLYDESTRPRVVPLPPGAELTCRIRRPAATTSASDKITLVYCGGAAAGVYRMPLYHWAVKKFIRSSRLKFVFISREDEIEVLQKSYSRFQRKRIQFLSMPLEEYEPDTPLAFGVTFFEHPYGKATVPLKLYSYLGMNFPVLAYDDCCYSEMINKHSLGLTCSQDKRSMKQLMEHLERTAEHRYDFTGFAVENSWKRRAETITDSLLSSR